jgi:uncharacterized protein (UPF0332 family)
VTPEAERFLAKARQTLSHGEAILGIGLGEEAARTAHLAAFHAAQALIYERTGHEAKTHRGVHRQFALLSKDETGLSVDLRRFLAQAYDLKAVADYATGPDAVVPLDRAASAVETARRFVDVVAHLVATSSGAR